MLEQCITNECKPSSIFLLLLCLCLRHFYFIIVLLMDLNQWTSWWKLQYLWYKVYFLKNDFYFSHPGVIHHGSQFSMGSINIWLRARKFFRDVSTAKSIHIGRRNSPEKRALLHCIFGCIIMSKVQFSKDYVIGRISLSFTYYVTGCAFKIRK